VRRAKLYYLRERQGKSARIKELLPARQSAASRAAARAAPPVEPTAGKRAPAASESPAEMATVE
jgi:Ribosomal protein L19